MSGILKQHAHWFFTILLLSCEPIANAQEIATFGQVTLLTSNANVTVEGSGEKREVKVDPDMSESAQAVRRLVLRAGEKATVSGEGHVDVVFSNQGTARLEGGTVISLPAAPSDEPEPAPKNNPVKKKSLPTSLKLLKGKMLIKIDAEKLKKDDGKEFRLETPQSLLAVKGTRFVVAVGEATDTISINKGRVAVRENETNKFAIINTNQAAEISNGQAPLVRKITEEEAAYDSVFNEFDLEFQEGSNPAKGHWTKCQVSEVIPPPKDSSTYVERPKFVKSRTLKLGEIDGSVLQVMYEPNREYNEAGTLVEVRLNPKPIPKDGAPTGVLLKVRATDLDTLWINGTAGYSPTGAYGVNGVIHFPNVPENTSDWIELYMPVQFSRPASDTQLEIWKKNGVFLQLMVRGGRPTEATRKPFTLEIAPVQLASRPSEE